MSKKSFIKNPEAQIHKTPTIMKNTYKRSKNEPFQKYCEPFSPKNKKNNFTNLGISIQRYASQQQFIPISHIDSTSVATNFSKSKDQGDVVKTPNAAIFQQQIKCMHTNENNICKKLNLLKSTTSTSSADTWSFNKLDTPSFLKHKSLSYGFNISKRAPSFQLENFRIIKKLGSGKFGKVFLVKENLTGFVLALKVLEKEKIVESGQLDQFIKQIKIQSYLNHPHITKLYGFFSDKKYFYILMELGCDGQLYNYANNKKRLSQEGISFVCRSLLQATDYMHNKGVFHRDIKPENIVLSMGNAKICDFGWVTRKNNLELRNTYCGTPLYLSPQLLKNQGYDEKVDIWAIGILAYELFCGCAPFNIKSHGDLYRIITQELQFPQGIQPSPQFLLFLLSILNKDPQKRLSSSQLLTSDFIQKFSQLQTCQQLCR